MKILVLGVSGMLGNAMVRVLNEQSDWQVYGTLRSDSSKRFFNDDIGKRLLSGIDVENYDSLLQVFNQVRPNIVINCVGLIKQLAEADDPLQVIPINTLLPHRLARLCELTNTRLVHMSTDCVFSGDKGGYKETDESDARDLYGRSKFLGELNYANTVTLRTSIIGHELQSKHGLVNWFLSQHDRCNGYTKAIFSGLPTVALAQVVRDLVIPNKHLTGVYHVAAQPISKYELLHKVAEVYGKAIEILPNEQLVIDRSLNADRFNDMTGYIAPSWSELIKIMRTYQ